MTSDLKYLMGFTRAVFLATIFCFFYLQGYDPCDNRRWKRKRANKRTLYEKFQDTQIRMNLLETSKKIIEYQVALEGVLAFTLALLKIAKSDSFRKNSTIHFLSNEFLVKMYKLFEINLQNRYHLKKNKNLKSIIYFLVVSHKFQMLKIKTISIDLIVIIRYETGDFVPPYMFCYCRFYTDFILALICIDIKMF